MLDAYFNVYSTHIVHTHNGYSPIPRVVIIVRK